MKKFTQLVILTFTISAVQANAAIAKSEPSGFTVGATVVAGCASASPTVKVAHNRQTRASVRTIGLVSITCKPGQPYTFDATYSVNQRVAAQLTAYRQGAPQIHLGSGRVQHISMCPMADVVLAFDGVLTDSAPPLNPVVITFTVSY